jgi:hypothetical protein
MACDIFLYFFCFVFERGIDYLFNIAVVSTCILAPRLVLLPDIIFYILYRFALHCSHFIVHILQFPLTLFLFYLLLETPPLVDWDTSVISAAPKISLLAAENGGSHSHEAGNDIN